MTIRIAPALSPNSGSSASPPSASASVAGASGRSGAAARSTPCASKTSAAPKASASRPKASASKACASAWGVASKPLSSSRASSPARRSNSRAERSSAAIREYSSRQRDDRRDENENQRGGDRARVTHRPSYPSAHHRQPLSAAAPCAAFTPNGENKRPLGCRANARHAGPRFVNESGAIDTCYRITDIRIPSGFFV